MTAQTALEHDKARLIRLGNMADRLAFDEWGIVASDGRMTVTTRRQTGEEVVLCELGQGALPDEIELLCGALDILRLLFRVRGRSVAALRQLRRELGRDKPLKDGDFTTNAAMLIKERPFQRFLETRGEGGPVRDEKAADGRLKALLGITTKRVLNEDARAQAAWIDLRGDYESWLRGAAR